MKATSLGSNPSLDAAHPVWELKLPAYTDSDASWMKRVWDAEEPGKPDENWAD